MRKKSLIVLFASISAVLAFFASNRMSVNEAISDNIEALTAGDHGLPPQGRGIHQIHVAPAAYGNHWYGYYIFSDYDIRNELPKCIGNRQDCSFPIDIYCWSIYDK